MENEKSPLNYAQERLEDDERDSFTTDEGPPRSTTDENPASPAEGEQSVPSPDSLDVPITREDPEMSNRGDLSELSSRVDCSELSNQRDCPKLSNRGDFSDLSDQRDCPELSNRGDYPVLPNQRDSPELSNGEDLSELPNRGDCRAGAISEELQTDESEPRSPSDHPVQNSAESERIRFAEEPTESLQTSGELEESWESESLKNLENPEYSDEVERDRIRFGQETDPDEPNQSHHTSGDFGNPHHTSGDFGNPHHTSGDFGDPHHTSGDFGVSHHTSGVFGESWESEPNQFLGKDSRETRPSEPESPKEDGELEEGELEDDDEEMPPTNEDITPGEAAFPVPDEAPENTIEDPPQTPDPTPMLDERYECEQDEALPCSVTEGKESKKRKHKEGEEHRKKKKKRHHHHHRSKGLEEVPDPDLGPRKSKKIPSLLRSTEDDFDSLLQREICNIVGSKLAVAKEGVSEDEQQKIISLLKQFKGRERLDESMESGSEEDWEGGNKRRRQQAREKKDPICIYFMQGTCRRGPACPYSHDGFPKRKMELCKFYMMNCCAKKAKCLYLHNDFPCKFFHFGFKCQAGEDCKFSHSPLIEPTKEILVKHIEMAPKDILGQFPRVSKEDGLKILLITEIRKAGEDPDIEDLEAVISYEGRGFKYLDQSLKRARKKGGEEIVARLLKAQNAEKLRCSDEESPKGNRTREGDRERESWDRLEREEKRERAGGRAGKDGRRSPDRDRERGRSNRFGSESPTRSPRKLNDPFANASDRPWERDPERPRGRESERPRERDPRHRNAVSRYYSEQQSANSPRRLPDRRHPSGEMEPEFELRNNGPRREYDYRGFDDQSFHPGSDNRRSSHEAVQDRTDQFSQPKFPDIDVSYLKNVLSAVQNQASVSSGPTTANGASERRPSSASPSAEDGRVDSFVAAMADDIKSVFEDSFHSGENSPVLPSKSRGAPCYSSPPDVATSKGRRSNYDDRFHEERGSKDPRLKARDESQAHNKDTASRRFSYDELSSDSEFMSDTHLPKESMGGGGEQDYFDRGPRARPIISDSLLLRQTSTERNPAFSIYNYGPDDFDEPSIPQEMHDDMMMTLPFRVPDHSSAKEIDASFKASYSLVYRLIEVDVPSADFSRLRLKGDPKLMEDPRVLKMLRRNSSELSSPRSRSDSDGGVGTRGDPDSRDPRKRAARDPRMEPLSNPFEFQKGFGVAPSPQDVRMAEASNFPAAGPRSDTRDPRMAPDRVPRVDSRDPRMDSWGLSLPDARPMRRDDRLESDDVMGSSPLREMAERPNFPTFCDIANMAMANMPQGIDPRGKPGLLGPRPGYSPLGMFNPFQAGQNMRNPFFMAPGMGPGPPFGLPERFNLATKNAMPDPSQMTGRRPSSRDPRSRRD